MAFATTDDITARLEESSLTDTAEAAASQLLNTATAIICAAVGETDDDWYDDIGSTRQALVKGLTVDLVCRAMASPQGLSSASETLGAHTRSENYRADLSSALVLTAAERLLLRQAIHGGTSASVMIGSHFQEVDAA